MNSFIGNMQISYGKVKTLRRTLYIFMAAAALIFLAGQAQAQESISIGDRVIPANFSGGYGTVIAHNADKGLYTVKSSNDGRNYHYDKASIDLTSGGKDGIKVGDQVIPANFSGGYGSVVAFNPAKDLFTVKSSNDGRYYRYDKTGMDLTSGVMGGLKVGDQVIPSNFGGGHGTVVAINPWKSMFTVKSSNDGRYYRYESSGIGRTSGGRDAINVGDTVIPTNFSGGSGRVVAFNAENKQYTVKSNNDGRYYRYDKDSLGLTSGGEGAINVGDKVMPSTFSNGYATVVAFIPGKGLFTVKGSNDGRYYRFTKDNLGLMTRPSTNAHSAPRAVTLVPVPVPAPAPAPAKVMATKTEDKEITGPCKEEKKPSPFAKLAKWIGNKKKRKAAVAAAELARSTMPRPSAPPAEEDSVTKSADIGKPIPSAPPALESASEKADAHLCKVCFEADVNCVITPCNHQGTCAECAEDIKARNGGCPFCRGPIATVIKVFKQ